MVVKEIIQSKSFVLNLCLKICLILGMAIAAQENNIEDLVTNTTGLVCSTILHEL